MKKLMEPLLKPLQPLKNKIFNRGSREINKKKIISRSRKYFQEAYVYNLKASKAIEKYEALLRRTDEQIRQLQLMKEEESDR